MSTRGDTVVPHFEPVSSGKKYEPEELPVWFREKVAQAGRDEKDCHAEKEAVQQCIDSGSFWTRECGEVLDTYDACQAKSWAAAYAASSPRTQEGDGASLPAR
ncbi:hypothetical protein DIPPA_20224 [Diplonema papillatum]|nr:hypothetical protein DIPPA_20224 [Diplonema papillatum]